MRLHKIRGAALGAFAVVAAAGLGASSALALSQADFKVGAPISAEEIAPWDIDISTSDGVGLPPGKGSVADGAKIFAEQCVSCHGDKAAGGSMYGSMVGGIGSFTTDKTAIPRKVSNMTIRRAKFATNRSVRRIPLKVTSEACCMPLSIVSCTRTDDTPRDSKSSIRAN